MRKLKFPLFLILIIFTLPACIGSLEEIGDPTQTPHVIVVTATPLHPTATLQATSQTGDPEKQLSLVVDVVDGDSIRVVIEGIEYSIRYIGIDAPEVQNNEWFGAEARNANAELVSGKEVFLEADVSDTDQYGRLLRYVYLLDGTFVNAELVRLGFAESKAYPPDTKYYDYLESLEQEAKSENLGLWQLKPTAEHTSSTAGSGNIKIIDVDKRAEYVDIQNIGDQNISLDDWILRSDKGDQDCRLSGNLTPGQILRIWALAEDSDKNGYHCNFSNNIWNNSELDPAVLFDASFTEIDRFP